MSIKDRFDLVIFDWAGTMVDFGCMAPIKALIEAFRIEGVDIDEAAARRDMGKAKIDHVRALLAMPAVASAWRTRHGAPAGEADLGRVMQHLGPLMRRHAADAAVLIPGARTAVEALRTAGLRVASSTGYTREMMEPVLQSASQQGYRPDHLLCSGDTPFGRPSPLMIYRACADLGVWPLSRVVKVDDAVAGIAEGRSAGVLTIGVASGNELGLSYEALQSLSMAERDRRLAHAKQVLLDAGADLAIDSIAGLIPALEQAAARQESAGDSSPARGATKF